MLFFDKYEKAWLEKTIFKSYQNIPYIATF